MKFEKTTFPDVYIITLDENKDNRGFFARSFCQKEFEKHGLKLDICQCNISYNEKKGTLRGMHYQAAPHEEIKLVSCRSGGIFDVIVDLRENSKTYGKWISLEITAENRKMVYIPIGFAHGFQTLQDKTEVFYMMGNYYVPESSKGVRWNSPALNISWPIKEVILSENDKILSEHLL